VVLLELITEKRAVRECEFEEGVTIVEWAKKMTNWSREGVAKIIDPRLSDVPMEKATHMFSVAPLCVQQQSVHRPTMREIVNLLTYFPSQH
jgi:hypothetical protein